MAKIRKNAVQKNEILHKTGNIRPDLPLSHAESRTTNDFGSPRNLSVTILQLGNNLLSSFFDNKRIFKHNSFERLLSTRCWKNLCNFFFIASCEIKNNSTFFV